MDVVGSAQDMGNAHIASDDGKHGQDHQRNGHDLRRFMDMVRHMVIDPRLSEEGHKERPEHIEGRHPRSYGSHQPEQEMAAVRWRRPSRGSHPC